MYLLRDADLEAHQARWARYPDRRWWIERAADFADEATLVAEERELRNGDAGTSLRDAYWAVANRGLQAIVASGQWEIVSIAYASMALTAYGEADEPDRMPERSVTLMREAHRAMLRGFEDRMTHVEIMGGPHGSDCKPCTEGDGRLVPIVDELTSPTLPHAECVIGWCPCEYAPVVGGSPGS